MQIPFAQDIFLCHLHVAGTSYYDARGAFQFALDERACERAGADVSRQHKKISIRRGSHLRVNCGCCIRRVPRQSAGLPCEGLQEAVFVLTRIASRGCAGSGETGDVFAPEALAYTSPGNFPIARSIRHCINEPRYIGDVP